MRHAADARSGDEGLGRPRSRIPMPPLARAPGGARAGRAGMLPPGTTRDAARAALAAHLETKGELRTSETLLVLVAWLTRAGMAAVPAPTLRAVYPGNAPPLGGMPDYLQYLVRASLLERVAAAVYRPTPLGAAVADALPDRTRVKALRAMRLTPPAARQTPWIGLIEAAG